MESGKKIFFGLLGLILAVEVSSWLSQFFPIVNSIGFVLIFFTVLIAGLRWPSVPIYALITELCIGSTGYLFSIPVAGTNLSLRMGLFVMALAFWLASLFKAKPAGDKNRAGWAAFTALGAAIFAGVLVGLPTNGLAATSLDGNGWLFLGVLPAFYAAINSNRQQQVARAILITATSWLAVKTILTLLIFAHAPVGVSENLYSWIRNSGVGEVTHVSGPTFRIFFQSQIFLLLGFFLILSHVLSQKISRKKMVLAIGYMYLTSFAILISQSRSYWVGAAVGLCAIVLVMFSQRTARKRIVQFAALSIFCIGSEVLLLNFLTGNFGGLVVNNRLANLISEPANSSRLAQLGPLQEAIAANPLFGYGFGKTLTYQSSDPRVVASHPDGQYTTYAFEWGYHDIALKIGILGLLTYLVWLSVLVLTSIQSSPFRAETVGLLSALLALLTTNIFSPYLNHPLGIGFILVSATLLRKK